MIYNLPYITLPIFMLRCTSQWSVSALLGSIMADYTPKSQRGRWKALGSITAMSWSGSAAVGGWLIDTFGYGPTFVITGCLQVSMIPLWCILLPLVAKESELAQGTKAAETRGVAPPLLAVERGVSDPHGAMHEGGGCGSWTSTPVGSCR